MNTGMEEIKQRAAALEPEFRARRERNRKQWLPFEFAEGTDECGFTANEAEQQVEHPFHCNVPTRIYFDSTTHDAYLQRDAEGRASVLLIPKERT